MPLNNTICVEIARAVGAYNRCVSTNNSEWEKKWREKVDELLIEFFPHGSGFDTGTRLDWDKSTGERLVFSTAFHHMNEGGFYDGWTEHEIIVTPSLELGFHLRVTGRNKNDIKEYIAEMFSEILSRTMPDMTKAENTKAEPDAPSSSDD